MYARIVNDLKKQIGTGELRPGDQLPTIAEMGRHYGVSRITTDRVMQELKEAEIVESFRGRGSFVKGIPELDFAGTHDVQVESIAALWIGEGRYDRGFGGGIWNGISAEAMTRGVALSLQQLPMNLTDIPLGAFAPSQGQGVIVLGGEVGAFEIALLANHSIPSVFLEGTIIGVDCIATDNHEGMRQGVEHLHQLGHRRIAFCGGFHMPGNTTNENERREAFERLCAERTIEALVFDKDDHRRLLATLDSAPPPTAFVFSRDEPALAFVKEIGARGHRVPEDVSVLSFDDYMPENDEIGLTAIRVDREGMGRAAVRHLLGWHLEWPRPMRWVRIRPTLTIRNSTGRAPAGSKRKNRCHEQHRQGGNAVMRKATLQTIIMCVVLAATASLVNAANYFENNYPTDLTITAASPQPWATADTVFIGSANLVNGVGAWDSTVIVASDGVVTAARAYLGSGTVQTSGRLTINGGSWTNTLPFHVGAGGGDGGVNEPSTINVNSGGSLRCPGLDVGQNGTAFITIDDATLNVNGGAVRIPQTGTGNGTLIFTNGAYGTTGGTDMTRGTGASSSSTLIVDGSTYTGHTFYMGAATCSADLTIRAGSSVTHDSFYCANAAGANSDCTVTISGAGSSLSGNYEVTIGGTAGSAGGDARVTVEEGGVWTMGDLGGATTMKIWPTATLVFGLGNGSVISSDKNVTIDDGANIEVEADSAHTPVANSPYDLVTTTDTLTVTPANLTLTTSIGGGFLQVDGTGKKLQFVVPPASGTLVTIK